MSTGKSQAMNVIYGVICEAIIKIAHELQISKNDKLLQIF